MENKQLICDLLTKAIQATRAGADIQCLEYDADRELVHVYSVNNVANGTGAMNSINVACDSGVAMIRDIMKYI